MLQKEKMAVIKEPEKGFSEDGYITNQDCFHSVRYRTMPSDINGCGWVAAYNLRHYLGHEVCYEDVRAELDDMHILKAPGPTLMVVMRAYLKKYIPGVIETTGREEALAAAALSRAGIFRYREKHEPHFIFFMKTGENRSRFMNVADGLEDFETDMESFGAEHFLGGTVIAFTI